MNNYVFILLLVILLIFLIIIIHQHYDLRFYKIQEEELDDYAIEVESIYRQMRGIRHDYRNHLQVMSAYLEQNDQQALKEYLRDLTYEMNRVDSIIRTGNTLIDALVNTKLSRAKDMGINIEATAIAPNQVNLPSTDLAVILGNLLNNAIEANEEPNADTFIRLYIAPMKNNLYINITNSMSQPPKAGFISKKAPNRIGYGLKRIDQAVETNQGIVNRQWEEGVFATEITLPLS